MLVLVENGAMEARIHESRSVPTQARHRGADLTAAIIGHIYNIPLDELRATTRRCARAAFARQVAMYLAHVVYGLSLTEVAAAFGRDRTTASHACHLIEDLRDNILFDRHMGRLENVLREAAHIEVAHIERTRLEVVQ